MALQHLLVENLCQVQRMLVPSLVIQVILKTGHHLQIIELLELCLTIWETIKILLTIGYITITMVSKESFHLLTITKCLLTISHPGQDKHPILELHLQTKEIHQTIGVTVQLEIK